MCIASVIKKAGWVYAHCVTSYVLFALIVAMSLSLAHPYTSYHSTTNVAQKKLVDKEQAYRCFQSTGSSERAYRSVTGISI